MLPSNTATFGRPRHNAYAGCERLSTRNGPSTRNQCGCDETSVRIRRRADDGFASHIERGVDEHTAAGQLLERFQQIVVVWIRVPAHGLNASRVVDVGDCRQIRSCNIRLIDAPQLCADCRSARRGVPFGSEVRLEHAFEFQQRLVVEPDVLDRVDIDTGRIETVGNGIRRKCGVTLLLVNRSSCAADLAIPQETCRAVVVVRRNPEHVSVFLPRSAIDVSANCSCRGTVETP